MYPTTGYNSLPSTAPRAVSTGIPTVTKTLVKTAVKTVKVTETAAAVTKFVGSSIHSIVPADLFKNATIAYKAVHKHVGPGELSLIHWGLGLAIAAGAGVGAGMIPERHLQRQRPRPPPGMGEIRWRRIAQRAVIGLKQLLAHNRVLMKELEDVKSNVQGLIPSLKLTTEELGRSIVKIKELHEALAVSRAEAADIRQELQRARDASRELEMRLKEKSAHCDEVQRQIEQLESEAAKTVTTPHRRSLAGASPSLYASPPQHLSPSFIEPRSIGPAGENLVAEESFSSGLGVEQPMAGLARLSTIKATQGSAPFTPIIPATPLSDTHRQRQALYQAREDGTITTKEWIDGVKELVSATPNTGLKRRSSSSSSSSEGETPRPIKRSRSSSSEHDNDLFVPEKSLFRASTGSPAFKFPTSQIGQAPVESRRVSYDDLPTVPECGNNQNALRQPLFRHVTGSPAIKLQPSQASPASTESETDSERDSVMDDGEQNTEAAVAIKIESSVAGSTTPIGSPPSPTRQASVDPAVPNGDMEIIDLISDDGIAEGAVLTKDDTEIINLISSDDDSVVEVPTPATTTRKTSPSKSKSLISTVPASTRTSTRLASKGRADMSEKALRQRSVSPAKDAPPTITRRVRRSKTPTAPVEMPSRAASASPSRKTPATLRLNKAGSPIRKGGK